MGTAITTMPMALATLPKKPLTSVGLIDATARAAATGPCLRRSPSIPAGHRGNPVLRRSLILIRRCKRWSNASTTRWCRTAMPGMTGIARSATLDRPPKTPARAAFARLPRIRHHRLRSAATGSRRARILRQFAQPFLGRGRARDQRRLRLDRLIDPETEAHAMIRGFFHRASRFRPA